MAEQHDFITPPVRITSIAIAEAAHVLSRSGGGTVDQAMIRKDIAAGCPINPDGTLSLVQYAAWLVANDASRD